MATSITEKILSSNKFYTDKYLRDTINLTKSILFTNKNEAGLYNEYIAQKYPSHHVDLSDKKTWRYYLHLSGQYHDVDTPIELISIDNGESIVLTSSTVHLHRVTRKELLKFDLFYKELVDRYPEQELLIKALINTSPKPSIDEIVKLEDYVIISHNKDLIEDNEDDLFHLLQQRIDNYKPTHLLAYYANSDNLFLASQYHIFFSFILKSIMAIRLGNAKTLKAHSYHILNYLSSHHYLDVYYEHLTKKQALYLYRNLLYLDNHVGQDKIFRTLIDKLFTERNMSVVNYTYSQKNETDEDNYMRYVFKQKLLSNTNLVYSYQDFELDTIKGKEEPLSPSNPKELEFNLDKVDSAFKNSLFSSLLTKDLETIVVDNTDSVPYKLIPTIIDYWAYLLKTRKMSYLVPVLDPISNREVKLSTQDLFKLFTLVLFKQNNQELDYFPSYTIKRVYKSPLPSAESLLSTFYRPHYDHKSVIENILFSVPSYSAAVTSFQFEQFVSSIYKLNIGLWLFTSNLSDKNNEAQFQNVIGNIHQTDTYEFNTETPQEFLKRIGFESLYSYSIAALYAMSFSILDGVYDNKLAFLNKYKYIQQAMIDIFQKFNSYTVQLIDKYTALSPLLVGPKDPRVAVSEDIIYKSFNVDTHNLDIESKGKIKGKHQVYLKPHIRESSGEFFSYRIPISTFNGYTAFSKKTVSVNLRNHVLNDARVVEPTLAQSSDQLLFLALNS